MPTIREAWRESKEDSKQLKARWRKTLGTDIVAFVGVWFPIGLIAALFFIGRAI
jgi:hypothetical protein